MSRLLQDIFRPESGEEKADGLIKLRGAHNHSTNCRHQWKIGAGIIASFSVHLTKHPYPERPDVDVTPTPNISPQKFDASGAIGRGEIPPGGGKLGSEWGVAGPQSKGAEGGQDHGASTTTGRIPPRQTQLPQQPPRTPRRRSVIGGQHDPHCAVSPQPGGWR